MDKKQITGKWTSANQSKIYAFKLTQIAATKEEMTKFQNAMENKANEFSRY
ncbi:hypothetical protein [Niabella ginsengisoli]|uniref:Uncharacterized protein n=1 Tax=Niabella ginsengisoli TaxID=522298 RepID=A0ABS9SGM1_9BACT|nr:hypothetical protein [Niabella ginsengisoli]MCH5597475.1 hypothetical protein [Niabella ginsengisoli]